MPAGVAALEEYIRSVDLLQATPAARDAMAVVLDPPGLDDEARELWRDLGQVAIGSLPGWARSMYGHRRTRSPKRMERESVRQLIGAVDLAFESLAGRHASARTHRAANAAVSRSRSDVGLVQSRIGRGAALARLTLRIGGRYVARSPQLLFASVERRSELRHDLALRSAEEVAEELGYMKGVLMKLGQMASYVDEDMPQTFRAAMSRLQHNAPPMSPELASSVIVDELGGAPERVFAKWDALPFAAASDRAGAPRDHEGRQGGRGQGAVPRHRPQHHLRPAERRVCCAEWSRRCVPRTWTRNRLIEELGERLA